MTRHVTILSIRSNAHQHDDIQARRNRHRRFSKKSLSQTTQVLTLQSGIGEALSEDLVKHGWQVAMADIRPNADLSEKLGDNASFHMCDVSDYDSQARCFQQVWDTYGRLDALCANAGIVDKR